MKTWLDWYVKGAAKKAPKDAGLDDLEAMAFMVVNALSSPVANPNDPDYLSRQTFFAALMPFVSAPDESNHEMLLSMERENPSLQAFRCGRGLKPSADLVQALIGSSPSSDVREAALSATRECTWYVDLPQRVLRLDEKTQIRAIFAQPATRRKNDLVLVAILTPPGANRMIGRFTWMLGDRSSSSVLGSVASEADPTQIRQTVEDFVMLLLAYRGFASDLVEQQIPQYQLSSVAELPKKRQKTVRNTATLFSIHELRPPSGRFGKDRSEDTGHSWTLNHAVSVSGHFRWQPHGPERKLRKLIWIAEHKRGKGPEKPVLDRL